MKPHVFATILLAGLPLVSAAEPDQARQRDSMRFRAMDQNVGIRKRRLVRRD